MTSGNFHSVGPSSPCWWTSRRGAQLVELLSCQAVESLSADEWGNDGVVDVAFDVG